MKNLLTRTILILVVVVTIASLAGCTNWKRKYEDVNVVYENCEGRLEECKTALDMTDTDRKKLTAQLTQSQQKIADLQKQIEEGKTTAGQASGFGDDMDVRYDAIAGTITVTLPNTILFSSGKVTLKAATNKELNHVRNVLRERYSSMDVDVVGHTDSDPIKKSKWKDNWQLSSERALAVLRYLTARDIRPEKIRAVAAGASRPIASNTSSAGKSKNRRVEIVVHAR
jgi:chemotaxis protein MotB